MRHVGQSWLFDYGNLVVRARYLSDSVLEWEQMEGPEPGKKGEAHYGHSEIRDDIVLFWWQEKEGSVTQVVDFEKGTVHTTWTPRDEGPSGFQGKVRPIPTTEDT